MWRNGAGDFPSALTGLAHLSSLVSLSKLPVLPFGVSARQKVRFIERMEQASVLTEVFKTVFCLQCLPVATDVDRQLQEVAFLWL